VPSLSGGKVPFAFVKNVVQIAFYMIAIIAPPGKIFQVTFSFQKCPSKSPPPLLMLPTPLNVAYENKQVVL
jgi:hypothetical protein